MFRKWKYVCTLACGCHVPLHRQSAIKMNAKILDYRRRFHEGATNCDIHRPKASEEVSRTKTDDLCLTVIHLQTMTQHPTLHTPDTIRYLGDGGCGVTDLKGDVNPRIIRVQLVGDTAISEQFSQ